MSALPETAFLVAVSRAEVLDDICVLIEAYGERYIVRSPVIADTDHF